MEETPPKKHFLGGISDYFSSFFGKIEKRPASFKEKKKLESDNQDAELAEKKEKIREQFTEQAGYRPDIENPQTFNEKLQWLKLFHHDPLLTRYADKYEVRGYIKERIGEEYLVGLLGAYDTVEEIDLNKLPDKFVLKVNHGSGQNVICKDKKNLNWPEEKEKLERWMKPEYNHYNHSYEWCYKDIKPKIVCEELIENLEEDDLMDYKFMCFNGKAEIIFVCSERRTELKVDFFDLNWNKLPFIRYYPNSRKKLEKPRNFDLMVRLAEKLAEPFPFARVDFYEANEKIYFGEITFYPGNGMEPFSPIEWDYKLGEMIKLPDKNKLPDNRASLKNWLIAKEIRFGGMITNVPRSKVSPLDPRTKEEIKTGGMVGGDRMLHHGYADKYAEYLLSLIRAKKPIIVAEIGILMGTGLAIWCDLFEEGRIVGFDIDLSHIRKNMDNLKKLGAFSKNDPELYEFDQFVDNRDFLRKTLKGDKIDVCIDDGFHSDESILKTMESVMPSLSKNFVYFIEDNKDVYNKIRTVYPDLRVDNSGELTVVSNR